MNVFKNGLLAMALAMVGCKERAAPPPAIETRPAESAHAATAHEHASPHGGLVQSTPRGHLELLVDRAGKLSVYLLDEELRPRAPSGSVTARVGLPGYAELALAARGDRFEAQGAPFARPDFPVVVTALDAGQPETARFAVHLAGAHAHAAPDGGGGSIIGRIVDSSCLARGERIDEDHTACAIRCIRGGAPIAIVEDGTNQVYIAVGASGKSVTDLLLPLVGRRSEIFGQIVRQGGSQLILVEEAVPEHDHRAREGGAVAMVGTEHLEVTALRSGEVRVWLSDEFRKPLPVAGRRGTVEARQGARVESAPLSPDGDHLAAKLAPLGAAPVEATVRLPMGGDANYFVTFMLDPKDQADAPAPAKSSGADVRIDVTGEYSPSSITLERGVTARLHFFKRDTTACTSEVVLPAFGVRRKLEPLGETIVEVTPREKGEFEFTCGMNMARGKIRVRD